MSSKRNTKNKSLQAKNSKSNHFRIAAYLRVSTEEQAENPEGSIKNQEQRLREYVKLKNIVEPFGEIVAVYSDPGISAKDMNRPSFQKMLKAIERREIDLVLVTELSRFSRSTKDFAILQEFLEDNECKFMSIRENFDTSGAAGSMVLNLMASIAEFERRQTAERISHSFLARAKRGLYNGGSLPLGYTTDPDRPGVLKPVPEEVELVKLFFKTFIKEGTLASTSKALNEMGIMTPKLVRGGGSVRGKHIRYDAVYRVLRNKSYIGIKRYQTKNGWEETKAQWEPIIDKATFDRVQKILDHNCSRRKNHPNKYPFTVTGLLICKECGESMAGASATGGTGKRVGYYEHLATRKNEASLNQKLLSHKPRRIPAAKIEPAVWDEVKKFVMSDEFVNGLLTRAKSLQGVDEKGLRAKELVQKSKALDRQISLLAERIAKLPEVIDPQPLIDQLRDLQKTQKQIQIELKVNESTSEESKKLIELEDLKLFRKGLSELISKGEFDLEMRSKIIKLIVHKIEIMKDGFEIHFHVGEAHYESALGDHSSSASFFVSFSSQGPKNKKAPEVLISEAIKSNLIGAKNFLHFQAGARSRRLTNGGPHLSIGARRQPHDKITFSIVRGPVISDKCAQLYASGLSLAEVARELGIAKATVLRNLRSHSSSLEQDTQVLESKLKRKRDHKSGNSPFGYLYVRGQLVVHPKEIEVVHKIIALWNSGSNLRSIADTLNGQGLTTRKGTIWRHPTITSILQRELKDKFNPQRRGE